jgi:hypothetical protein
MGYREGAWQLLREYLEAMPQDQNYKYYDFCLEKMLDYTGTDLPWWMVQRYEVWRRNIFMILARILISLTK